MTRDTTPTENKGYDRPEKDEQNWESSWDNLVESLDDDLKGIDEDSIEKESLSIERATISGLPVQKVDTKTDNDEENDVIEFTDLGEKHYGVRFVDARVDDEKELQIYFNHEDETSAYFYWREDGGKVENADTVHLIETSSAMGVFGWVTFSNIPTDTLGFRFAFRSDLTPMRQDVVDDLATRGGRNGSVDPIDSLQIEGEELDRDGTKIELWEVL